MSVVAVGLTSGAAWPVTEPTPATGATSGAGAAGGAAGVGGAGDSFADVLGNALDGVQATQTSADSLATQAATGSLTNVADYMTAAEEANISTQLTSAVRNSALQAFQSIMGMQL